MTVHLHSPSDAKIALFRSLFRGRDDVYACRFESRKTGKAGYAPACGNEWVVVLMVDVPVNADAWWILPDDRLRERCGISIG